MSNKTKKINIIYLVNQLEKVVNSNPNIKYCLYLAHKDEKGWAKSTSRVYMNDLLEDFVYLPIDIEKDDYNSLRAIYEFSESAPNVVAINQTQPHKSNLVLKEYFKDRNLPANVDAIIKDDNGNLVPYDLNGPSFMSWYKGEVGSLEAKTVIILGVGGVGEPLARAIVIEKPCKMFLVDYVDKSSIVKELSISSDAYYFDSIEKIEINNPSDIVFINAAGKEGTENQQEVEHFIKQFKCDGNVFVDLRPHLNIPVVEMAKGLGWLATRVMG